MKTILFVIVSVIATFGQTPIINNGARNVTQSYVKFGADSSLKIYLINSHFYKDSANLGTVKKRIDNTSDSCSGAVSLYEILSASDAVENPLRYIYPTYLNRLEFGVKSNVADSNTFAFRIQTRSQFPGGTGWTDWMDYKLNNSYPDVTIQDSVVIINNARTAKTRQYSLYSVFAAQARFCPEVIARSFKTATDTMAVDSITNIGR